MSAGPTITEYSGRVVFDLTRGNETTTRSIDVAYPMYDMADQESIQAAVDALNTKYTSAENSANIFIQPANWRDTNRTEETWTTTGVHYEMITTSITPFDPTPAESLSAANHDEQQG